VVAEMALAMVLLTGAGLMIRSIVNVRSTNTGVNTRNVLVMRLFLPNAKYPHDADQIRFHERLKARLEALPGVEASTVASTMPTGGSMNFPYELEHSAPVDENLRPKLNGLVISPDYFRVMDVRLIRGRAFTEDDGAGAPVVIVNQRLAEKIWPGEDALGKRLRLFDGKTPKPWITVVGIAPNILQNGIAVSAYDPLLYFPYRQFPLDDVALMARTRVPPATLINAFRRETQAADGDLPLYDVRTLEQRLATNGWELAIVASLFSIFAGIALALAAIGLYAVIAHSVNQRTQEIGVRLALGASQGNILRAVFRQGMLQLAIGLAVGIAASIGLTRFLSSMLVLVTATDPITFILVGVVLGVAAILGCVIPARRAARVDPVIALRYE
jgi:putative ABC transport system permease protein